MQCYVDDPLFCILGKPEHRDRLIGLIICVWRSCGYSLAFGKAKRGIQLDWIVANYTLTDAGVRVMVKEVLVKDTFAMAQAFALAVWVQL